MLRTVSRLLAAALGVLVATAVTACGVFGTSPSSSTVTVLMGKAPDSLDPGAGYTAQAAEADWLAYTGLLTYAHASGPAGTKLIPGLARGLPTISDGGKTYTFTLRGGLRYSNGVPVRASDFVWTVERDMRIPWGGAAEFLTTQIAGASNYAKGTASTISGLRADDETGQIKITLVAPYGPVENVLAFPALGLVPRGTPMRALSTHPPPGVGPYVIENVVAHRSFDVVRNSRWSSERIPGIPAGHLNITVDTSANVAANARDVLNGAADVFDFSDAIPAGGRAQISAHAADRYRQEVANYTDYVFLNTSVKPFNHPLARQAVLTALDRSAITRLSGATLRPGCYFLPPAMVGHPDVQCPYGTPPAASDLARARRLLRQSRMSGAPVTVWSPTDAPRQQWMTYYTSLLTRIGFRATLNVVPEAAYFSTIGTLALHPQTGFADWSENFPNPVDFYLLLEGSDILPSENANFGEVRDPHIDQMVSQLAEVPASRLPSVASRWQALDRYVAGQAYVAVLGYQTYPAFTSSRLSQSYVFHPVYGWDWSSFQLR